MNKNFLSKKSWHTGSMKHMEKVWIAEQKHEEEQKKIEQLKRELAEEQKILDLKKLQDEASGKPKNEKLDWMYMVKKGPSTEEYLTGKSAAKDETEDKELEQLASKPGALWLKTTNSAQDAAAKIRDDPLLLIKQQQQHQIKEMLNNPVQVKKIKQSKDMIKMMKKLKKQQKKEKKDKKEKKKKKRKEDEGSSSSSEDEKDKKDRTRSTSPGPIKDTRREPSPSLKRDRSRSPRRDVRKRSRSRSRSPKEHKRYHRSRSPSEKHNRSRSPRDYRDRDRSSSDRYNRRDDRPNDRANYRNFRGKPKMTQEERERRLREMQNDGELHEAEKTKQIEEFKEREAKERPTDYHDKDIKQASDGTNPKFLKDMHKKVYTENDESLQDRVKRNIHFIDRSSNDTLDQKGFL